MFLPQNAAVKTIEKKDNKLSEIDKIINEEITPKLEKLRKERSSFIEYQKIKAEVEHLTRLVAAFMFFQQEV